jgi:glycogen operon protein
MLFNAHDAPIEFTLPDLGAGEQWDVAIDTAAPMLVDAEDRSVKTGQAVEVDARSVLVLQKVF